MYTLTNLTTGVNYKTDVVKAFQDAIASEENLREGYGSTNFWNFVSADMHLELNTWYAASYIDEAFEYMADLEDEDRAAEINALRFA
jgi:hypothetical protein